MAAPIWNVLAAVFLYAVAGFLLVSLLFAGDRVEGRAVAATLAVATLAVVLASIALFKEGAGAIRPVPE